MGKAKTSRRPIEYVLYVVLVCNILLAFWVLWQTNVAEHKLESRSTTQAKDKSDIGQITQNTIELEEKELKSVDSEYRQYIEEVEAAASNVGGVFDETTY